MKYGIIMLIIGCLIMLPGILQLKDKYLYTKPSNFKNMLEFILGGAIVALAGLLKILNI